MTYPKPRRPVPRRASLPLGPLLMTLGGVLILWDRLFGTYEGDCEGVERFGIGAAPTPMSPLAANFAPVTALWARARAR